MAYLVCENCEGCYELQEGESPEDFEKCQCGGKLVYYEPDEEVEETIERSHRRIVSSGRYHSEKMADKYFFMMIGGAILAVIGFFGLFIFRYFAVLILIAGVGMFKEGSKKTGSWRKGARGEKRISRYLINLPEGFWVFNDVKIPTYRGNIDHVIIGPNGIFVIETKNYRGNFILDGNYWKFKGKYGTKKGIGNPGFQARRGAVELMKFLSSSGINGIYWIYPIFTVLNGNVSINKFPTKFEYVEPNELVHFILNTKKKTSEEALKESASVLTHYCTEFTY